MPGGDADGRQGEEGRKGEANMGRMSEKKTEEALKAYFEEGLEVEEIAELISLSQYLPEITWSVMLILSPGKYS